MKLYITYGRYFRTQDEAKAHAKAKGGQLIPATDFVEFPTKQGEIVDYLNDLVSGLADAFSPAPAAAKPNGNGSYTERSVAIDDEFEALPIHRQLTLAGLAVENATRYLSSPPPAAEQPGVADDLV